MNFDDEGLFALAEIVLENIVDWRRELRLVDPSFGNSWVTVTRTFGGSVSRPVESYVVRREDLAATIRAVEHRLRRLTPELRAVYRTVYCGPRRRKHFAVAQDLGCHKRTVDRDVRRIKQLLACTLTNLGPKRLRDLLKS